MAKMSDLIEAMLAGAVPPPPIARLVGFRITAAAGGEATLDFEAGERHHNPMGTVHGGILCDVADAAMGLAFATTLGEGEAFTTLELKINFLKTVRSGPLHAVAQVVKRGQTIGLAECDIRDERDDLVARASSTCMVRREERAPAL